MPRFLVGAGLVAAATYAFVLLSGTELVGGTLAGRYVELLMLGVPAVGLVYGGYWLHDADFDPDQVWRIGLVAVAGTVLATAGTAALVLGLPVLRLDPRASFVLLVSTGTEGALLGVLVGTFAATDRLLRRERAAAAEFEMLDQLLRHNVRNRLTIIGGHLTRLAETPGADGDAVATIEAQLDGIESLLEDTRLATEAVGGTADPEPVDLVAVVREQVRLLQESHDRVAVETDLPERAPVLADDLLGGSSRTSSRTPSSTPTGRPRR